MQKAIIGKKVGMTQIFDESGKVIPVTVVEAGPCVVTQKKTAETDGYTAVQLGFGDVKESKLSKPEAGHLKKAGVAPKKYLKVSALTSSPTFMSAAPSSLNSFRYFLGATPAFVRWPASGLDSLDSLTSPKPS